MQTGPMGYIACLISSFFGVEVFFAEIYHHVMEINLKPLPECFKVPLLRPQGLVCEPAIQFLFENLTIVLCDQRVNLAFLLWIVDQVYVRVFVDFLGSDMGAVGIGALNPLNKGAFALTMMAARFEIIFIGSFFLKSNAALTCGTQLAGPKADASR